MQDLLFKFQSAEDAEKVDLTRVGTIAGTTDDGKVVRVEPDVEIDSNESLKGFEEGVWAGLAACGLFVAIERAS